MKEEKDVINSLDSNFDKTKLMVTKVAARVDDMIVKASGSMCSYVLLFTIIIIALVYKLT